MYNPSSQRESSFAISPRLDISTGSKEVHRWAIILAGGDGSRLLPLTRKIAGDDRPKQFCPIVNGNTLLAETRQRVALTLSPARTMYSCWPKDTNVIMKMRYKECRMRI